LTLIIIMLGTNDLKEHTAQASVNGVGTLIRTIQTFDQPVPRERAAVRG